MERVCCTYIIRYILDNNIIWLSSSRRPIFRGGHCWHRTQGQDRCWGRGKHEDPVPHLRDRASNEPSRRHYKCLDIFQWRSNNDLRTLTHSIHSSDLHSSALVGEGSSRGLLRDCEIFANPRLKLYISGKSYDYPPPGSVPNLKKAENKEHTLNLKPSDLKVPYKTMFTINIQGVQQYWTPFFL